ncbi:MAG: hypothetical protein ACJ799_03610 [Gemmatimonadaceae bacterium]
MKYAQPKITTMLGAGSPIPAAIALACFVAMVGCGEPTGPRTICCAPHPQQPEQTVSALAVLVPELHDAADVFVQGVGDSPVRVQAELAINRLADQLLAGNVSPSRVALAQVRSLLAGVDDVSAIELAPVALALDHIERRMNQILNSLA